MSDDNNKYPFFIWSDRSIADSAYEISCQYRRKPNVERLAMSKMLSMRTVYQAALDRLHIQLQAARGLLGRAEVEIDLRVGDDAEMAQLKRDIADFLRSGTR